MPPGQTSPARGRSAPVSRRNVTLSRLPAHCCDDPQPLSPSDGPSPHTHVDVNTPCTCHSFLPAPPQRSPLDGHTAGPPLLRRLGHRAGSADRRRHGQSAEALTARPHRPALDVETEPAARASTQFHVFKASPTSRSYNRFILCFVGIFSMMQLPSPSAAITCTSALQATLSPSRAPVRTGQRCSGPGPPWVAGPWADGTGERRWAGSAGKA